MIKAENFKVLFDENYNKLAEQSRIIYWKGNDLGYNDNIYTSDDLLHDLFFSIKAEVDRCKLIEFNNMDHFFAFTYVRMKSLYMNYLKKKWNRSQLERTYFRELGYTYEKADIFNGIFDYELDDNDFIKGIGKTELIEFINEIENEEHRRILLLKMQDILNEKICKYFNYKQAELRSKLRDARIKLFDILILKGVVKKEIKFKDFVGISTKTGIAQRRISNSKYLYTDYPFEKSYKEKIKFIIHKNRNKIDLDLLPEVLKYNEGYQLKKNLVTSINYALELALSESSCFILDGIVYLKGYDSDEVSSKDVKEILSDKFNVTSIR